MADSLKDLQSLLGKKALDPVQQTVFEKGPQASFTPPEVQNVYQEGKTYFSAPQVAIEQSNIDWYTLGQNAFDIALKTFTNVEDYLIDTKRNKVRDLTDLYQSKLDDAYMRISTEQYNANKEKRPKPEEVVQSLTNEIESLKKTYKNDIRTALGDEATGLMDENIDMNQWGLKYQELGLTARGGERNLDKTANRILYELQRVTNSMVKEDTDSKNWKYGVGEATKVNKPGVFMGTLPVPRNENGLPLIGMAVNDKGEFEPKMVQIGNQAVPVIAEGSDGEWYFNPITVDSLSLEDHQLLFDADNKMYGDSSFVVSMDGRLTPTELGFLKQVAKNPEANNGLTARASVVLNHLTDKQFQSTLRNIPDIDEAEQMRLSLIRQHTRSGLPQRDLQAITSMNYRTLQNSSIVLNQIESGNISASPDQLQKYNDTIQILADVATKHGYAVSAEDIFLEAGPNNTMIDDEGITAAALLQKNPGLRPIVARVMATIEANGPNIDPERRAEITAQVLKEQINASNWIALPPQADGIPLYIYAPGLQEVQIQNQELRDDPNYTKNWPEDLRRELKENPSAINKHAANSMLMDRGWLGNNASMNITNPAFIQKKDDYVFSTAQTLIPNVNRELFLSIYNASTHTTIDPRTGASVQDEPTLGELLRMAVAASPTAIEAKSGVASFDGISFEERLQYSKAILDDLPIYDKDGKFMSGVQLGMNLSDASYSMLGSKKGGIPLNITKLEGQPDASGRKINYMNVISTNQTMGEMTPRKPDGTPALMIRAEYMENTGAQVNVGRYKNNLFTYSRAVGGDFVPQTTATYSEDASNPSYQSLSVMDAVRANENPYMPNKARNLFTNMLVDRPLTTKEDALAFIYQNNKVFHDAMQSDKTLRRIDKHTYNKDSEFMSPEVLGMVYDKAVASGAKTNADFVAYVFGTIKTFAENKTKYTGRLWKRQETTKAKNSDFAVTEGLEKGLILYDQSSDKFFDGIHDALSRGYNIYVNSNTTVGERPDYYMLKPEEFTSELQAKGLSLYADATRLPTLDQTEAGKRRKTRMSAQKIHSILYPNKVEETGSEGLAVLFRPTTLPSDIQKRFSQDFADFAQKNNLQTNVDSMLIDWPRYYQDKGSFPDSIVDVPEEYYLGGKKPQPVSRRRNIFSEEQQKRAEAFERLRQDKIRNFDENPMTWYEQFFTDDSTTRLRTDRNMPSLTNYNVKLPERVFNTIQYVVNSKSEFNDSIGADLGKESWNKLKTLSMTPLQTEYQVRLALGNIPNNKGDNKTSLNQAIALLDDTSFELDPSRQKQFVTDMLEAFDRALAFDTSGNQSSLTRDELTMVAKNPGALVDIKKAFFDLTINPDGYIAQARKTARESRIDALTQIIRNSGMFR